MRALLVVAEAVLYLLILGAVLTFFIAMLP